MRHFSISRFCPQLFALLVLAASLVASCVTAFSAEVGLAWDAPAESDLAGYKVHYVVAGQNDVTSIDVGNVTTYTVSGLDPGTYCLCVTAYDTSGNETSCSNEVWVTLSPPMYGFRDENESLPVVVQRYGRSNPPLRPTFSPDSVLSACGCGIHRFRFS